MTTNKTHFEFGGHFLPCEQTQVSHKGNGLFVLETDLAKPIQVQVKSDCIQNVMQYLRIVLCHNDTNMPGDDEWNHEWLDETKTEEMARKKAETEDVIGKFAAINKAFQDAAREMKEEEAAKRKKLAEEEEVEEAARRKKIAEEIAKEEDEEAARLKKLAEENEEAARKSREAEEQMKRTEEEEHAARMKNIEEEAARKKKIAEEEEEAARQKKMAEEEEEAARQKKIADDDAAQLASLKCKVGDEVCARELFPQHWYLGTVRELLINPPRYRISYKNYSDQAVLAENVIPRRDASLKLRDLTLCGKTALIDLNDGKRLLSAAVTHTVRKGDEIKGIFINDDDLIPLRNVVALI